MDYWQWDSYSWKLEKEKQESSELKKMARVTDNDELITIVLCFNSSFLCSCFVFSKWRCYGFHPFSLNTMECGSICDETFLERWLFLTELTPVTIRVEDLSLVVCSMFMSCNETHIFLYSKINRKVCERSVIFLVFFQLCL